MQSESAEYTHHVSANPSHDVKLRNKLIFLSLDLLYSKAPDSDVLMFVQDNGMTREEFMWFMKTAPAGFQVMGNDYYGHNEKLLLPDGTITYGEDVLGWYLITLRYYRRYYKPVMHTETNTPFPDAGPQWLWKQWTNVLRMRRDGIPVLGFTWYSLIDQIDWDTQLTDKRGRVMACGLFDMDRKPRPVAAAYRKLLKEFSQITALAHGEMFEPPIEQPPPARMRNRSNCTALHHLFGRSDRGGQVNDFLGKPVPTYYGGPTLQQRRVDDNRRSSMTSSSVT